MNEKTVLWVLGELVGDCRKAWEIVGIYDSEELAANNATTIFHFVGPVELNATQYEPAKWPGTYFPLLITENETT